MTSSSRSAVVVGAGIGGLATGVALRRAGWDVTVHERADALRAVGAGIVLAPNAVHALDALGVDVRERGHHLTTSAVRRPDGRALTALDASRLAARHGAPVVTIGRADLHALLADALGRDAVRCGSPVDDVTALDADLVVAADGVRSAARDALWPGEAQPTYAGYTTWRALVRTDVRVTEASETWGHRERFGVVPVGDGLVYLFATATLPEGAPDEGLARLRRRFGGWHAPIPALLDAVDPADVLRHDVVALSRVPATWHRGNVVLVGDAAHAMEPNLGQGAGLALEDAVVLAHALADGTPTHVGQALAAYTAARRRRAVMLHAASRRVGRLTQHVGTPVAALRDTLVRATPATVALRGTDGPMGWRPPAAAHARA